MKGEEGVESDGIQYRSSFGHDRTALTLFMKNKISSVTVYAASSSRIHEDYFEPAERLGRLIAEKKWRQVNGGGEGGLMG
eukprot:CAMPEP_0184741326 /NCGR_PEP_ID=MMETSP0315-20130426/4336_1 /TAXON_ID=101924 /ORGANISM="Rhodosorus marinus, Strain UTEX LB 2760" /LENGTH=79 /DNA_ID=CAMNT_0027211519 /DNA_START=33 /DNA_END=268 /DNA_ORIENTATION=+